MPEFPFGSLVPFPRDEVFEYLADPRNWPLLQPEIEAVDDLDGWDKPGGRCVLRLRGGRTQRHELLDFDQPRLLREVARSDGLPEIEHERVFADLADGTWLQNYARYDPRPGIAGLFDRTVLAWVLRRRYQRLWAAAAQRLTDSLAARQRRG
ncbi:SRPBCC family protein [Hamadaea sp. NPDC050747]|uniref:SRPBCC family protein n=1 Tax=Hamadaea sp. NPDC050747 TaxID=3155789 RepID=UPI0033F2EDD8